PPVALTSTGTGPTNACSSAPKDVRNPPCSGSPRIGQRIRARTRLAMRPTAPRRAPDGPARPGRYDRPPFLCQRLATKCQGPCCIVADVHLAVGEVDMRAGPHILGRRPLLVLAVVSTVAVLGGTAATAVPSTDLRIAQS